MANHQTFTAVIALALVAAGNPLLANANGKLSMSVMALAKQCAPNVAPETVGYVVSHESRNNPFAVHVSCYNTGNQRDGFTNGYVGKILAVAQANNGSSHLRV